MGAVPGTSGQPPTRLSDQGNSPRWDFQPMAARPGAAMIGRWLQIRLSARDLSARRRTLARSAGRRLRRHLGAGRHTARSGHAHRRRTRQRALQRHLRKRVGLAPGRDRPGRRRQRHHRRQHPSATSARPRSRRDWPCGTACASSSTVSTRSSSRPPIRSTSPFTTRRWKTWPPTCARAFTKCRSMFLTQLITSYAVCFALQQTTSQLSGAVSSPIAGPLAAWTPPSNAMDGFTAYPASGEGTAPSDALPL